MGPFIVRKQIRIKATPEVVWDALTNPEKTKKYFFHCRVYSDWEAGSPITFKGRIFLIKKIELHGSIIRVDPGRLLQYALVNGSGKSTTTSVVTDTLDYVNGETILSISDDVGSGDGAEKRYEMSMKGWDKVLAGLKTLVEAGG